MNTRFFWSCRLALLAALLFLGACAETTRQPDAASLQTLVWPKPPEQERVRFLASVSGPGDWGITRSWWQRLSDSLSGRGDAVFKRPSAVVERAGVLVVADPGAQAVWLLDKPRNRSLQITHVGAQGLVSPVALALGPGDSFFLADTGLRQVFQLNGDGVTVRSITLQGMERPAGVVWDDAVHRLYVLDSLKHRITVFDGNAALLQHLGRSGDGDAEFNHPTHLALDVSNAQGNLLVNDAMNFRIQSVTTSGGFLWKFGQNGNGSGDLAAPKGIATDSAGHVYVVDALFDLVQIFDRQGQLLLSFGEHGSQPGQFTLPRGIFIASDDKVYVADAYNQRVQVFLGAVASSRNTKEGVK